MLRRFSLASIVFGAIAFAGCTDSPNPQDVGSKAAKDLAAFGPASITLTPISTPFNTPIGIDHHGPTNKVVMSVNYGTGGVPYNLELVASDGSRSQFSSVTGLTDEIKIATAKDALGGFTPGELFCGNGNDGEIVRISADGTVVQNPWVSLGAGNGLMRGSLYVDRTGVWGGDLIVVTTVGEVWRISSAGAKTHVASIFNHLEGLITVPNDVKYGPWAGKAIAGAEGVGAVYAIGTDGSFQDYYIGISPEDIDLIPANQNFFGVDFGSSQLMGAPASAFAGMVGDILMAQEFPGNLYHVRWNGTAFETELLAVVGQWEHVTFSTAGIVEIPPIGATLDIHPTSCPNPFNMAGLDGTKNGLLPVAIIGSPEFDVTTIDLSTLKLSGVAPVRTRIEDVNRPAGNEACACTTAGPDGIMDIGLKFSREAIAATLGTVNDNETVTLTLTGKLKDGTSFSISDCILIRNASKYSVEI